ncbi:EAL domain-containing protein [Ectothiorhodospiraceae bacterium WFHF3C12]|nr:EAL domain-containing protein [Ectothiorhodospiraceae bacterium WFHF3C12]
MSNVTPLPMSRASTMTVDADGRIAHADAAWDRALRRGAQLPGSRLADFLSREDARRFNAALSGLRADRVARSLLDVGLPDGGTATLALSRCEGGEDVMVVLIAQWTGPATGGGTGDQTMDVSRALFDQAFEPMLVIDPEGRVLQANPAAARFLGVNREALAGLTIDAVIVPPRGERTARSAVRRALAVGQSAIEAPSRWQDPTDAPVEWRLAPLPDGAGGGGLCLISPRDTGMERQRAAREDFLTRCDQLTGLRNRRTFQAELAWMLESWQNEGARAPTVALLNLDAFREVNAAFGNAVGDQVLRTMAERLCGAVRDTDVVARFSGDVFALLLGAVDPPGCDELARRLLDCVAEPIELSDREICVTACLGMASTSTGTGDSDPVCRAERALSDARHRGRDAYVVYSGAPEEARDPGHLWMTTELRHALGREEFQLLYQPQVVAATGEVVGLEALLRWNHPERGLIPPAEFIPVLEESSLIVPVGEWVLARACEDLGTLRGGGFHGLRVSVNLSPRQLEEPRFLDRLESLLAGAGIESGALELELTESLFMSPMAGSDSVLSRLGALGLRVAVDDFGTGYSALAYLKRFPVHCLKIDKSFTRGLGQCREDTAIVNAVCQMAAHLGLDVVAEGVETQAQVDYLAQQAGAIAQGFHFARPLALTDLMARMTLREEAVRLAS